MHEAISDSIHRKNVRLFDLYRTVFYDRLPIAGNHRNQRLLLLLRCPDAQKDSIHAARVEAIAIKAGLHIESGTGVSRGVGDSAIPQ